MGFEAGSIFIEGFVIGFEAGSILSRISGLMLETRVCRV